MGANEATYPLHSAGDACCAAYCCRARGRPWSHCMSGPVERMVAPLQRAGVGATRWRRRDGRCLPPFVPRSLSAGDILRDFHAFFGSIARPPAGPSPATSAALPRAPTRPWPRARGLSGCRG
eukprot:6887569-Prymnesium_polylepis.1